MILDRLRVQGKLNLLLVLPMAAVFLVTVPYVSNQVGNARSSAATADAARHARQFGALVWELQRERLLTVDFLADAGADDTAMLLQQQLVDDTAQSVSRYLGPNAPNELTDALVRLQSLAALRDTARVRAVAADSVARTYHAVIEALIDALRLVPQMTSDAEGTRELTALDALLRANEESSLLGVALLVETVSPQAGRALLTDASAQSQMFTARFAQQADADQAALVARAEQGEAANRLDALVGHEPSPAAPAAVVGFAQAAMNNAEAQASVRRLVQDQVTSQIAGAAAGRAKRAAVTVSTVATGATLLIALVIALVIVVSRSIARPLVRVARAAAVVANLANAELVRVNDREHIDEQPPRLIAIDVSSGDEIGDLATAFNQVQATAVLLLERQVTTRRNVSLMFANVAQRNQNLVRRQLALVDELERDEHNARLLSRLGRLDHLSTRLRRNADHLLVIAGSPDDSRIHTPTPLTAILRSALTEIEDYQRVSFGQVPEVTVAAALVADLVLVFAELLENATAFSPPRSVVDVHAEPTVHGWYAVSIIDHGMGMTAQRLAEENHRLVERERLDITPTSVLGLFVVGRLARRHGLLVQLTHTSGGGTTATVTLPQALYTPGTIPGPQPMTALPAPGSARRVALTPSLAAAATMPDSPDTFSWFAAGRGAAPPPAAAAEHAQDQVPGHVAGPAVKPLLEWSQPPHSAQAATTAAGHGSRHPRVGGAQRPSAPWHGVAEPAPTARLARDAHAHERGDAPEGGAVTRADDTASVSAAGPGDPRPLASRRPGASLVPGLRERPPTPPAPWSAPAPRDPEAERATFDGYTAGVAAADPRSAAATAQPGQITKEGSA